MFEPVTPECLVQDLAEALEGIELLERLAVDPDLSISRLQTGLNKVKQQLLSTRQKLQTSFEKGSFNLVEALSQAVEQTAERLGLFSRVSISGEERSLPASSQHLLYRITQLALYKISRHTGTRRLRLALTYGVAGIELGLEDDGFMPQTGTDLPPFLTPNTEMFGHLHDLQRHIEYLGGTLEMHSNEEQGSEIHVQLPYEISGGPIENQLGQALNRVRILIVDNQSVTRAGLRHLLEAYPDLQVIGEASEGTQAVSETLELGPQIVLLDLQLPAGQSLEALRQIKQLNLETRILLLVGKGQDEALYNGVRAGADGYLLKESSARELAEGIRAVARGEVLLQPQLVGQLISRLGRPEAPGATLTTREREVLQLLARGLRNKEIAGSLSVSERTVNFHLANIYQKLQVSGRTEAISKALDQGLIGRRNA